MAGTPESGRAKTALIVGASRGLGHAIAAELAARGWDVVGTVRDQAARTPLQDLAARSNGHVTVEQLDINDPNQYAPLHERIAPPPWTSCSSTRGPRTTRTPPSGRFPPRTSLR